MRRRVGYVRLRVRRRVGYVRLLKRWRVGYARLKGGEDGRKGEAEGEV